MHSLLDDQGIRNKKKFRRLGASCTTLMKFRTNVNFFLTCSVRIKKHTLKKLIYRKLGSAV